MTYPSIGVVSALNTASTRAASAAAAAASGTRNAAAMVARSSTKLLRRARTAKDRMTQYAAEAVKILPPPVIRKRTCRAAGVCVNAITAARAPPSLETADSASCHAQPASSLRPSSRNPTCSRATVVSFLTRCKEGRSNQQCTWLCVSVPIQAEARASQIEQRGANAEKARKRERGREKR